MIADLELKNEDYLVKYKESEYEDDDLKIAYAILQFWREHNNWEFVIYFSTNWADKRILQKIFETEISIKDKITVAFGAIKLWFYLGTKIYSVWKIKIITDEKAIINRELLDFISKIMGSLSLNKDNLKVSTSKTINSQIIENDLSNLKIAKVSTMNTKDDIYKQESNLASQSKFKFPFLIYILFIN